MIRFTSSFNCFLKCGIVSNTPIAFAGRYPGDGHVIVERHDAVGVLGAICIRAKKTKNSSMEIIQRRRFKFMNIVEECSNRNVIGTSFIKFGILKRNEEMANVDSRWHLEDLVRKFVVLEELLFAHNLSESRS